MSKEYERIREKALLTDEEITELITEEERRNGVPEAFIRAEFDLDYHKAIAQAQVDKLLKLVRIEADKKDIELYPEIFATGLKLPSQAEMEMLRGFLSWLVEEAGFVRCLSKEAK